MSTVNADVEVISGLVNSIKCTIENAESAKNTLKTNYQKLGCDWKDSKYSYLGEVVEECSCALNNITKTLLLGQKALVVLCQSLNEYEGVNLGNEGNSAISQHLHTDESISTAAGSVEQRLKNAGVLYSELGGLPTDVQEKIAASFEQMALKYPESQGSITSIRVSGNMRDSTPAATGYSVSGGVLQTSMNINPAWFSDPSLNDRISECVASGQWAGYGIGGIINHEIAHAMHLQLDAEQTGICMGGNIDPTGHEVRQLSDSWINNTTTNDIRDSVLSSMGMTRDDICNEISDYADSDGSECFAEAIADVTTSQTPSILSINIVNEYQRRLLAVRNGGF